MGFLLEPIERVSNITKEEFEDKYLNTRQPVIITDMAKNWPAYEKWTFDHIKETVGNKTVPLYDNAKADPSKPINVSASEMDFSAYIDLIQSQPTELRIFAYDIFKHAPKLLDDYCSPKELMGGFLDRYPNMFFGGKGSVTFLHYDIDLAHIFHTHFHGRKHIILFDYKWKERLYRIPFATYALEDYDVLNPDTNKFPALNGVQGVEAFLEHGETLFMPTGWWHWMKYLNGSFSISLRAWDKSPIIKAKSLYNLTIQRKFDDFMKTQFKDKYMDWKEELAIKRAMKALEAGQPII
ncbi:cupin [Solitalea longa]|uniref:Cupin n=1 Tax=Solitalea longa TaxID=2079460 RepID=A0A2S5A025_9SPHI|nr:cupin-like domain-containing protein [Solitalea longa]POY35669.1 cupin [Solitalea longa]